jgi:hypothetical protein
LQNLFGPVGTGAGGNAKFDQIACLHDLNLNQRRL